MAKKNLFCVSLVEMDVPEDMLTKYWLEVEGQISKLENIYGKVNKLYHEANYSADEAGLSYIQMINKKYHPMIKSRVEKGLEIQPLEDKELFLKVADCQLFLTLRFSSKEVMNILSKITQEILQLYQDAIQKRRDRFPIQIKETLKDGDTGILIIREEERIQLQFPADIDVILVRPPILSEIEKWQREQKAQSVD